MGLHDLLLRVLDFGESAKKPDSEGVAAD
jgi:hypothetical protein